MIHVFWKKKKKKKLRDENKLLEKEIEELKSSPTTSIEFLKIENENFNEEICYLKKIIERFLEGKRNSNICLINEEVFSQGKDLVII